MKLDGQYKIPASTERVWRALNDPETLRAAIPGAESVEKTGEYKFHAVVKAKIGPISARFKGDVEIREPNPPHSCVLVGEGKGGVAGFAKGQAKINLEEQEGGTLLSYEADAAVGGKMAQLGQRLIRATAAKMAAQFFGAFSRLLDESDEHEHAYIDESVVISPSLERIVLILVVLGMVGLISWTYFY